MAKLETAKTLVRTPNNPGTMYIASWKFDAIHAAILTVLDRGPTPWKNLTDLVRAELSAATLADLGSLGWYTISVKLEMEVRGEIMRVPNKKPQLIVRCDPKTVA